MGQSFSNEYIEGLRLGRQLADGHVESTQQQLSQYVDQLSRAQHPETFTQKKAAVIAGMRNGDSDDVKFVNEPGNPHYVIDWFSESYVNQTFDLLNKSKGNPEQAIKSANSYLAQLPLENRTTVVADFNRRSQQSEWSNIKAHQDPESGSVRLSRK